MMIAADVAGDRIAAETAPGAARLYALVPCAGVGARSGVAVPKQYHSVAGRTLIAHVLAALGGVSRLTQIMVVTSEGDELFARSAPNFEGWVEPVGGDTRARTVANGLDALVARGVRDHDWVLVHDAARCLVRPVWIDALIDDCIDDEVGGLLAWPLADTLKLQMAELHSAGGHADRARVARTIDRHGMWQAQTPQMFRVGMLREALAHAGSAVTDDASAIEAMGHAPRLVRGSFENFKLTYPSDFDLAERLLASRPEPSHQAPNIERESGT